MMNPPPRQTDTETQKLIDEYLKNGGEITYCATGERSEEIDYKGSYYTKRKLKKKDSEAKK